MSSSSFILAEASRSSDPRPSSLRIGTLSVVLVALALAGYYAYVSWKPKPAPKPDATWVRITQEGVLRIGIDPSFPPFEADDGKGNLSGLDIALAQEWVHDWSAQTGKTIKVQYVYTGFDGLYDALKTGQFDVILSALPYDPRRTQDVLYSHSYYNSGPMVVVRSADMTTKSWYDLANKRVGVELGSSGDSFARKWQNRLNYDLREFNTPKDALQALSSGQVDGVLTDGIAVEDFLHAQGGVKTAGNPLVDELIVAAVRKDTPTLLQEINAVIDAMKSDGRLDQLQKEWF